MSNARVVEEINKALLAHGAWKMRLRTAISKGSSELSVEDATRDDCCAFGKWLYSSSADPDLGASIPHQTIKRLHKEFHKNAGKVLDEALRNHQDNAISLLKGEFGDCSQSLIIALTEWKRELAASKAA